MRILTCALTLGRRGELPIETLCQKFLTMLRLRTGSVFHVIRQGLQAIEIKQLR